MMANIEHNWKILRFASHDLRADFEFVLVAVHQDCDALEYVAEPLKSQWPTYVTSYTWKRGNHVFFGVKGNKALSAFLLGLFVLTNSSLFPETHPDLIEEYFESLKCLDLDYKS